MSRDPVRQPDRRPPPWAWAVGAAVLVVLAFFASRIAANAGDGLVLIDRGMRSVPSGGRVFTATFENRTDRTFARVAAEIALMDADGRVVGGTTARTGRLPGGRTWVVQVPVPADDAASFRVRQLRWSDGNRDVRTGPYREREIPAR